MPASSKGSSSRRATRSTKPIKKAVASRAKKPAKKKPAAKKKVARKSTKKTTRNGVQSVPIKRKSTPKSFTEKLQTLEALQKSKATKPKPVKPSRQLTISTPFSLALLSPYRFPISADTLAIQTARYGGVFFVLVGGFFTMLHAQYLGTTSLISPATQQVAQLSAPCSPDEEWCDGPYSTEEYQYHHTHYGSHDGTQQDEKVSHEVFFDYSQNEPLSDTVTLEFNIDDDEIERIKVSVRERESQTIYKLGEADWVDDNLWELDWNTTAFPDGRYKVMVLVKNEFDTYTASDSYQVVENDPLEDEYLTSLPADETESIALPPDFFESTTTEPDAVPEAAKEVAIQNDFSADLSIDELIVVTAEGADSVKLYLAQKDSPAVFLGQAYSLDDETWEYWFAAGDVPPGRYRLIAKAAYPDGQVEHDRIEFQIVSSDDLKSDPALTLDASPIINQQFDVTQEITENLSPTIELVADQSPNTDYLAFWVTVADAHSVALFASPQTASKQLFLGQATKRSAERWQLQMNTAMLPNNDYDISAEVETDYGVFMSPVEVVSIKHAVASSSTSKTAPLFKEAYQAASSTVVTTFLAAPTAASSSDSTEKIANELIKDHHETVDKEFRRLAAALRSGDEAAVSETRARITTLKTELVDTSANSDRTAVERTLTERFAAVEERVKEDVERTEKIVRERTGVTARQDTDQDGVTDYDEINIFNTDPLSADSDGDGFTDGAEILRGYNPTDATPEAVVVFESPKEVGIVREDILEVENIVAVEQDEADNDGVVEEAIITGRALPNSYVTLYIFSTPVVVTVKTDEDGSWNYRFDKELEDGAHEVYVGVTDNAGKIVAKSEPFTFIKEAEAFTPTEAASIASTGTSQPEPSSLFSDYLIYLVLSISVVAIGLVLILLGLHLDTRPRPSVANDATPA